MVFLDIGEQLLIESVLQQCPLGVLLLSITNAELLWRNQMATTLLGAHASIGETFGSQRQGEQFLEQIRNDKPFYHHIEDGGFVFVPQTMTTPDGSQGVCIVWMIPSSSMDVDLANLQRDWLQQRKLATVGQMIVEMVHELSNPLSSISMGTQLIAMSVSKLQQRLPRDIVVLLSLCEYLLDNDASDAVACNEIVTLTEWVDNDTYIHAGVMLMRARALRRIGELDGAKDVLTAALRKTVDRTAGILIALRLERFELFMEMDLGSRAADDLRKLRDLDPVLATRLEKKYQVGY